MIERMTLLMLAAALSFVPATAAPVPPTSQTQFQPPEGWTNHSSSGMTMLEAPEGNFRAVIVEVGSATDAKSAAAAAWQKYRGAESHPLKLLTARPARNGWDEQA